MESSFSTRIRRVCGALAMAGFAALLIAARPLAADIQLGTLDEQLVRAAAHFAGYGFLAVLLALATGRTIVGGAIALVLAAAEEAYQRYVPSRTASFGDWMCDASGIASCLVIWSVVVRLRLMRVRRSPEIAVAAVAAAPPSDPHWRARGRADIA
jgi:VanZ family protein